MSLPEPRAQEAFYGRFWEERDSSSKAGIEERDRWEAIRRMAEAHVFRAMKRRPMRILDLGCGRGWLSHLLSPWGEVLGVDPLEASVEHARSRFPDLRFERATAGDLLEQGFAGAFDLIVSSEVIEHVHRGEQLGFLRDTDRLLADHGWLILTAPRGELWSDYIQAPRRLQPVEEWLSEDELDRLVEAARLRVVARDRAHLPRRSPTWQGRLLAGVFQRRLIRDLPLGPVRRRLAYAAKLYQVILVARTV